MSKKSAPAATRERPASDALLARLRRIEGQIRGIQRMLEQGRECDDILTQLMAARSGLDQAGLLIMDRHIERCLLAGLPDSPGLRDLQRALQMWLRFGGPTGTGETPDRPE